MDMLAFDASDIVIQCAPDPDARPIAFSHIRPFIEQGASDPEILAAFPDLKPKKLLKARNFHAAKHTSPPDDSCGLRILCDENVSSLHLHACQKAFKHATSIAFEKMTGKPDSEVWRHAYQQEFDYIVTNDRRDVGERDLTRIAACAWRDAMLDTGASVEELPKLPMLLHLTGDARTPELFPRVLEKSLHDVFNLRVARSGPVVRLNQAGATLELSAFDLIKADVDGPLVRNLTRQEQWARKFLTKILPQEKWADREDPHVLQRKRTVTRAVAAVNRNRRVRDPLARQMEPA